MTEAEYEAMVARRRAVTDTKAPLQKIIEAKGFSPSPAVNKYRNKKTVVDGITFDSAKEARRWGELKALLAAKKISCLERQRVFILAPSVTIGGRRKPELKYVADFYYLQKEESGYIAEIIEDVKSKATAKLPVFRIKQHLMKHIHGVDITLI